jgi:aspartyl-tRNA(Asn)/glutamyl-tRNA(Gln) amidotransferase subunit C
MIKNINIDDLATLSKLNISQEESAIYKKDLEKMLLTIEDLKNIKVGEISPLYSPLGEILITRKDSKTEKPNTIKLQNLSSNTSENFYLVPKVI